MGDTVVLVSPLATYRGAASDFDKFIDLAYGVESPAGGGGEVIIVARGGSMCDGMAVVNVNHANRTASISWQGPNPEESNFRSLT